MKRFVPAREALMKPNDREAKLGRKFFGFRIPSLYVRLQRPSRIARTANGNYIRQGTYGREVLANTEITICTRRSPFLEQRTILWHNLLRGPRGRTIRRRSMTAAQNQRRQAGSVALRVETSCKRAWSALPASRHCNTPGSFSNMARSS